MRRHTSEPVEGNLDRSGATPGLMCDLTDHLARVVVRFTHLHTRTAGLVGRVPPPNAS